MGLDAPTLRTGSINTDHIYVDAQANFNGDIYAMRSLVVGQAGILSRGPIVSGATAAAIPISAVFGAGLVVFGGQTVSTLPALKRSGASLQVRMGDDSDYAAFQSGNVSVISTTGGATLVLNGITDVQTAVHIRTNNVNRWILTKTNTAETGSNVGGNFALFRHDDAGTLIDNSFIAERSTGNIGLGLIASTLPQANLHVGRTASTARVYNVYTDTANGEWALIGNWATGVAQYGSAMNGTGVARDVSFVRGGTEQLRLTSTGPTATGLAFSGGVSFGSTLAPGGATDLSRHIALWGTNYGFGVTSGRFNYVAGAGGTHRFMIGGADIATFSSSGL
jgi:hypothetical protein